MTFANEYSRTKIFCHHKLRNFLDIFFFGKKKTRKKNKKKRGEKKSGKVRQEITSAMNILVVFSEKISDGQFLSSSFSSQHKLVLMLAWLMNSDLCGRWIPSCQPVRAQFWPPMCFSCGKVFLHSISRLFGHIPVQEDGLEGKDVDVQKKPGNGGQKCNFWRFFDNFLTIFWQFFLTWTWPGKKNCGLRYYSCSVCLEVAERNIGQEWVKRSLLRNINGWRARLPQMSPTLDFPCVLLHFRTSPLSVPSLWTSLVKQYWSRLLLGKNGHGREFLRKKPGRVSERMKQK